MLSGTFVLLPVLFALLLEDWQCFIDLYLPRRPPGSGAFFFAVEPAGRGFNQPAAIREKRLRARRYPCAAVRLVVTRSARNECVRKAPASACGNCNRPSWKRRFRCQLRSTPRSTSGTANRSGFPDGAGLEVRCLLGYLWITEEGDGEDRIIANGESFVLDRPGLSLATALTGPALVVVQPGPDFGSYPLRQAA